MTKNTDEMREFELSSGDLPVLVEDGLRGTGRVISGELERSRKRFFVSFVVLSVIGYFCSLAVCSQNSLALTGFSISVAAALHQLPDPLCPVVCGTIFSIVPVGCLFLFLDRFQRRRLIVRYWWLPCLTTLASCLLMTFLPESMQHDGMHAAHANLRKTNGDAAWLIWWASAAISIPLLVVWFARRRASAGGKRRLLS